MDIVEPLLESLKTEGEKSSVATPRWEEFETLADEYGVGL